MSRMRRVLALILMMCLLASNLNIIMAAPVDSGGQDQGSSGASYNEGTGEADIETGTSGSGNMKDATKDKWAISKTNGTFTPTKYTLTVLGGSEQPIEIGIFYDVDWTVGVESYKNTEEDIANFKKIVAGKSKYSLEELIQKDVRIDINALVNARPPHGSYKLYSIKDDYKLLTSVNGDGTGGATFIKRVVDNAGNNLGVQGNGWAYYTVPGKNVKQDSVVKSYVKVVGVNSDGTLKLEEVKPTEVVPAEKDEKGALIIERTSEIDEGTAYFNDIIVSTVDLTQGTNIDWTSDLPKSGSRMINPTPFEITQYRLGEITGTVEYIIEALSKDEEVDESINKLIINGSSVDELDEFNSVVDDIVVGKVVDFGRLQRALLKAAEFIDLDTFNYENASPEFKQAMLEIALEEAVKEYNKGQSVTMTTKAVTETLLKSAIYISDLNEVYLETESLGYNIEIPNYNSNPTIKIPNFKSSEGESNKNIAYIRYVVIPTRKEVTFNEVYKDGVLVDRIRTIKNLPLNEVDSGLYESETYFTDLRSEGKELVSWGTSKETPLLNQMPTNPLKSGNQYEPILGLETDENVYVTWKTETFTETATSNYLVDEWRLSKYTDNIGFKSQAYMGLSLRADQGHRTSTLSPSGRYNYDTVNPNGKLTDNNYNPDNMKYNTYLHSKALTQGNYSISHNKPSVLVDVTGNLNLIKSTELAGLRIASWTANQEVKSGLNSHNLEVSDKGVNYAGDVVIKKQDLLKFAIKNKESYTHNYGVYYHPTRTRADGSTYTVCRCYTLPETPGVTYDTADYKVDSTFERYKAVNTDSRLYKLSNIETKVENGKTTVSEQSSTVLNVYPEIPMLFDNDKGDSSVKFAIGDMVRKVQPVTFHALEYKVYVDKATTTGMSVATDSRAKATAQRIGLGSVQVINKGSGLTTNFEVKDGKGSSKQGILEVRTYALDIQNDLKAAWGNTSYNTSSINDNFLSKFGSKQGGKWVFNAKATEKIFVASSPNFTGAEVVQNPKFSEKSKAEKEYKLTVRGGVVTHVNGTSIATIQTSNPNLYEALVGMKLVGVSKDQSVLSTFEHQTGKALSEQKFKDLAKSVRGVDNLELGKGWYSEDSTVLVVKEYITELTVPNTAFTAKIPMTVPGLQTPVNKQQFYSVIAKGHNIVKYEVGSNIKVYFEHNTSKESNYGKQITGYGVPNVSITDTMFGN